MELFLVVILEVPEYQYDIVKSRGAVWMILSNPEVLSGTIKSKSGVLIENI